MYDDGNGAARKLVSSNWFSSRRHGAGIFDYRQSAVNAPQNRRINAKQMTAGSNSITRNEIKIDAQDRDSREPFYLFASIFSAVDGAFTNRDRDEIVVLHKKEQRNNLMASARHIDAVNHHFCQARCSGTTISIRLFFILFFSSLKIRFNCSANKHFLIVFAVSSFLPSCITSFHFIRIYR